MARIDPERAQIVIRLVYDGPAKAGKTTSLRRLAQSLGVDLFSAPEEDGRTLYFDWLNYVGGLYDSMSIRCQVISAPGQLVLESRRRWLLESADAVVFVADSSPERSADNERAFATLREVVARDRVPAGIVIQANKRDLPGAVSLDHLRDSFGRDVSVAMTEAVAQRAEGVRETFVLGVRLALDRVRALRSDGALPMLAPEFESGDQLLGAMMAFEAEAGGAAPPSASPQQPEPPPEPLSHPRPPDSRIPPGLVWPPVQGRVVVHEAAREPIRLQSDGAGSWQGVTSSGRWMLCSGASSFRSLDEGREALIAWARWHSAAGPRLSPERAIVLAPTGDGEWRLWQIVHASATLRDLCRDLIHLPGPAASERLFDVLELYAQAFDTLVVSGLVDGIGLHTVALSDNGTPVLAAAAPLPPHSEPQSLPGDPATMIARDLLAALRDDLSTAPEHLSELLAGIEKASERRGHTETARSLRQGLLNT